MMFKAPSFVGNLLKRRSTASSSSSSSSKKSSHKQRTMKKQQQQQQRSQESLGGVFATVSMHRSSNSIQSNITDSTADSAASTWSSSGSPLHHKGAPLVVPRSVSLVGGGLSRGKSTRNLLDQPATLGQVMAKARMLPPDSDYISSNHVMVNNERTNKLVQPLVRLPALDEIARTQAESMARAGQLSHQDPNELADAIHRPSTRLGENVARGSSTREMHMVMMKNASDKNNIIDGVSPALELERPKRMMAPSTCAKFTEDEQPSSTGSLGNEAGDSTNQIKTRNKLEFRIYTHAQIERNKYCLLH
eukprot:CAMPEP_0119562690 /NCGR_PEP_ID=MMETSP1352-20130426/21212_1 /TAXON_ID=265584 /ORGANISM="Stauroneis constricta, Strain CCMP1120" /LENGTH=304 /DNA_ID=CAMNT_0007611139 /DNA_START=116 /DNA_END=1031 /DNA_ORIENTATION=+